MKRTTVFATAIAIAGSALFAAPASADPWLTLTSDGGPVTQSGQSGQVVQYDAGGCTAGPGIPGYIGQFIESSTNPEYTQHQETIVDVNGAFSAEVMIGLVDQPVTMSVRWYCSTAPVSSPSDPAILYLSPVNVYTIAAAPAEGRPAAAMRSATSAAPKLASSIKVTASKSAAKAKADPRAAASSNTSDGAVTLVPNPDALPVIDRMGIEGKKAAALKANVDRTLELATVLPRLTAFLSGKPYVAKPVSNADYVSATFATVTGKVPSAKVMAPYVARLDGGALRVSVVEDIALTKNTAAYWNKR